MENPVVIDTGRTFKRSALRNFWEDGRFVDPVTDEDLISSFYYSNLTVKSIIRKYQKGELMPNVHIVLFRYNQNKFLMSWKPLKGG